MWHDEGHGSWPGEAGRVHPELLGELARHRQATSDKYVFPSPHWNRDHVAPYTVQTWLDKVYTAAGVPRLTPHQLRHTCIATINDETEDLRTAQVFAGHARSTTTERYTRTTTKRLNQAMRALDVYRTHPDPRTG